jgi:hypothetical protein
VVELAVRCGDGSPSQQCLGNSASSELRVDPLFTPELVGVGAGHRRYPGPWRRQHRAKTLRMAREIW